MLLKYNYFIRSYILEKGKKGLENSLSNMVLGKYT